MLFGFTSIRTHRSVTFLSSSTFAVSTKFNVITDDLFIDFIKISTFTIVPKFNIVTNGCPAKQSRVGDKLVFCNSGLVR